jgi:translation initiation factor 6
MTGTLLSIRGNPMIGLYIRASEEFAVVGVRDNLVVDILREKLDIDVVTTTIAGSELAGAMVSANSKGIVVCSHASSKEINLLSKIAEVHVLDTNMTCLGNVICINDKGAIVHPEAHEKIENVLRDKLDVEVMRGTVGGIKTVGMAAAVTNRGGLVHPNANDWEVRKIERCLGISVERGTVNFGQDMVGAGLVANSKGYIAGDDTTGFEVGIVEQALGFV